MKSITLLLILLLAWSHQPALADACLTAPVPRLSVGDAAVIVSDGLSLRALPAVSTGIDARLYSGHTVTVIGGPSCNGVYSWWRVQIEGGRTGWIAEGDWDHYFVVPAADADQPPTPFEAACLLAYNPLYCL